MIFSLYTLMIIPGLTQSNVFYNFELVHSIKLVLKLSNNWSAVLAQLPSGSSIAVCSLFFSLTFVLIVCWDVMVWQHDVTNCSFCRWVTDCCFCLIPIMTKGCNYYMIQSVWLPFVMQGVLWSCVSLLCYIPPFLLEMQPHRGLFQVTFLATVAVTCMVECVLLGFTQSLGLRGLVKMFGARIRRACHRKMFTRYFSAAIPQRHTLLPTSLQCHSACLERGLILHV